MACNNKPTAVITDSINGYRTITEKDRLCSFSFEFSDFYEVTKPSMVTKRTMYKFVDMYLLAPKKTTSMLLPGFETNSGASTNVITYTPASIEISKTIDWGAASIHVDELLRDVSTWPRFILLERNPVIVDGFPGEQIVYVNDTLLPFPSGSGEGRPLQIIRAIYFNVGNDVWTIEAESEMSMADQVKADFEHIIQTLKILD
jgi:hypothetical protein